MTAFRAREITPLLRHALRQMPVVVLTGLRQSGKSTLLQREPELAGRRYCSLDDFAQLEEARRAPESLVGSAEPLTIDEAQRFPELLTAIKREVDRDRRPGRFLLSGSANFSLLRDVSESLAGRAVHLALHPFTRREIRGTTETAPFLTRFFAEPRTPRRTEVAPIRPEEILRGGMPSVCLGAVDDAKLWFRGYEQTYLERDVRDLSRVSDLVAFRHLLRLATMRTAQVLKQSELARDAKLNAVTAGRYLALLEASFVLWRLPPYLANRASRLIKSPKIHAGDTGLACHLAGVTRLDAAAEEPMRGALFETWVVDNIAALCAARWPDARLCFWHVQGRHEVDLVIEDGRDCLAIEVKAAERWDDRDLAGLRAFLDATPRCRAGILAHNGTTPAALGERLWAVPIGMLVG
jgi:predicted AAA+ superfamily ATPase